MSFPETRQLILKKINGGRRKRSGGTELAIGHNVADLFDNFWSGNRDNPQLVQKVSPLRVPLCFCRLVSRLSSNSWGTSSVVLCGLLGTGVSRKFGPCGLILPDSSRARTVCTL